MAIPGAPGPTRRPADPAGHGQSRLDIEAVQVLAGVAGFVSKLALLQDLRDRDELLKVILSFPSLYQTAARPLVVPGSRAIVPGPHVQRPRIDRRRGPSAHTWTPPSFHEVLRRAIDEERMHAILGYGQPTVCGIADFASSTISRPTR